MYVFAVLTEGPSDPGPRVVAEYDQLALARRHVANERAKSPLTHVWVETLPDKSGPSHYSHRTEQEARDMGRALHITREHRALDRASARGVVGGIA